MLGFNDLPQNAKDKYNQWYNPITDKDKVEVVADPVVQGAYAMRIINKEYNHPLEMLFSHGDWEEVEFESWPPQSGSLRFF